MSTAAGYSRGMRRGRGGKVRRFVESGRRHPHAHPRPVFPWIPAKSGLSTTSPALRLLRLLYSKLQLHFLLFRHGQRNVRCAELQKKYEKTPCPKVGQRVCFRCRCRESADDERDGYRSAAAAAPGPRKEEERARPGFSLSHYPLKKCGTALQDKEGFQRTGGDAHRI